MDQFIQACKDGKFEEVILLLKDARVNPADKNNMCNWAMRCLLIEEGNRLILIDNGIGDKQENKFFFDRENNFLEEYYSVGIFQLKISC